VRASTSRNDRSGPIRAPTPSPDTRDNPICVRIALVGVLYWGSTLASALGNDPFLAIRYHMRVPTFAVARQTAIVVFRKASSRMTQPPPQNRWASTRPGSSADLGRAVRLLTPQPMIWPQ